MFRVNTHAYCGMSGGPACFDTKSEARAYVADKLRARRRRYRVTTLARGAEWEVLEPDDCAMVPDACGTIALEHVTYECRECGCRSETPHDALHCCADYNQELDL